MRHHDHLRQLAHLQWESRKKKKKEPQHHDHTERPISGISGWISAVVRAREGRMLGMRQPLDGPIFETLEDGERCIHAMISHYDRRLGMSDATIQPFKGMVELRTSA